MNVAPHNSPLTNTPISLKSSPIISPKSLIEAAEIICDRFVSPESDSGNPLAVFGMRNRCAELRVICSLCWQISFSIYFSTELLRHGFR